MPDMSLIAESCCPSDVLFIFVEYDVCKNTRLLHDHSSDGEMWTWATGRRWPCQTPISDNHAVSRTSLNEDLWLAATVTLTGLWIATFLVMISVHTIRCQPVSSLSFFSQVH